MRESELADLMRCALQGNEEITRTETFEDAVDGYHVVARLRCRRQSPDVPIDAAVGQLGHVEREPVAVLGGAAALGVDHRDPAAQARGDGQRRVGLARPGRASHGKLQLAFPLLCFCECDCHTILHETRLFLRREKPIPLLVPMAVLAIHAARLPCLQGQVDVRAV